MSLKSLRIGHKSEGVLARNLAISCERTRSTRAPKALQGRLESLDSRGTGRSPQKRDLANGQLKSALSLALFSFASVAACSAAPRSVNVGNGSDAGTSPELVGQGDDDAGSFEADDFWEKDPPPQWCGKGKAPPDAVPGGTPECPSDKNKEGCPCPEIGAEAPCWPGLRKDRHLGICKDGVTRCEAMGELDKAWGPCKGAVKPKKGATKGGEACACFSKGTWALDNVVPCIDEISPGVFAAVSTVDKACPSNLTPGAIPQKPAGTWSENRLTADCAGHFKLCYAIKAGNIDDPKPSDCVVAKVCTEGDYTTPNKAQDFPPLPHWVTSDTACVGRFESQGGYSEMTVIGKSVRCDAVDDDGAPLVFRRGGYCPATCSTNPSAPECQSCATDASGSF